MNPKVSIIIISYNEKKYLPQAVNSCLSQSYDNIEIIIGDDGSTDGSIEYINSLGKEVHYFIMQRDNGPVIASVRASNVIKRGLDEASGDYILILSGDDYFTDFDFVSDAVSFLEKNKEYFAYVTGFQRVDESGYIIDEIKIRKQSRSIYWSGSYTHISCFVFRKMHSDELLVRMNDDTGLQYVLSYKGKWKFCKRTTLAYRQRENSIQHKVDLIEMAILEIMVFQDVLNYSKRHFYKESLARFYRPFVFLVKRRKCLESTKYYKYIHSCEKYNNNIISYIIYKKKRKYVFKMFVCYIFFRIARILTNLFS